MKPSGEEERGQHRAHQNTHVKLMLTSLSATAAETSTFPIDLTKTRLQLDSSSSSRTNAFRVASEIVREQGPLGLYKGLSPAIIRHLLYTPIRIVAYENLRNAVVSADGDGGGGGGSLSLSAKALAGGFSGVIAQVVASPADLVKVRMQADGRLVSQGLQPRYSGPLDALNKIVHTEGFGGLWKGVFPNVQRAFLVNMGELACYDHAKRFVIQNQIANDNIYAHTLASIMSGLSATTLSCPADVVKTRMMNQAAGKEGKIIYNSSYDCLVKTVRIEGLRALWKGFFPTWARLGPWQFVFWVSYEKLRQIAAQVVASPADPFKVRMQAEGHLVSQGLQPRYSGLLDALNKIVRTEGFGGLWKGVFPNVQRTFLVNMGELACYDHAKRFVIQNQIANDNIYAHTLASIMSGLSAATLSCPADAVKTRMMNQAAGKEGKIIYNSSYDCFVKTVRIEGLRELWKGFFPTWARLGPWQFLFWVSYEKLRQIAGLSSF